ncbi:DUF2141 domain-containing protein [Bacteroidota bacterium]
MKIITLLFIISCFILNPYFIFSQDENTCNLTVKVNNIKSNKGTIQIALCNSEDNYTSRGDDGFMQDSAFIKKKKTECTFKNIPYGTYAVKIFHDKNGNKILDVNSFGIPSEDYGFSNDAKGMFGPARWEDAKFEVNTKQLVILIDMQ